MNHLEEEIKPVKLDIGKMIRSSKSWVVRNLPGFLVRWLTKTLHQDELNHILNIYKNYDGIDFSEKVIEYFNFNVEIEGLDQIPSGKRYIFAANHTLGGIDGLLLMNIIHRKFGKVKTIINELLLYLRNLQSVFVGVSIFGGNTKEKIEKVNKLYESDSNILIFPAGLVSRKIQGKIQDLVWKKSFVTKAIQYKIDIVPIHTNGRLSDSFYRLSNFRKAMGIKKNIEILFLSKETFKQKNKAMKVVFGKPIPWQTLDHSITHEEWAKKIREQVYAVGEKKELPIAIS